MTMHIRIDWTRCDGHGVCAALLPDRIDLDEWRFPIVRRPIVGETRAVRSAAAACPALALHLEQSR